VPRDLSQRRREQSRVFGRSCHKQPPDFVIQDSVFEIIVYRSKSLKRRETFSKDRVTRSRVWMFPVESRQRFRLPASRARCVPRSRYSFIAIQVASFCGDSQHGLRLQRSYENSIGTVAQIIPSGRSAKSVKVVSAFSRTTQFGIFRDSK